MIGVSIEEPSSFIRFENQVVMIPIPSPSGRLCPIDPLDLNTNSEAMEL